MHHKHLVNTKNLAITVLLNILITIGEFIGGLISGSVALLSDASHNLSDVISLIISYLANKLSKRQPTVYKTFGWQRIEIIAALVNSSALIVLSILIIVEALSRLILPQIVEPTWIVVLAAISIFVNLGGVLLLKKDSSKSLNIKAAYLHLFSDMLTSIAVLVGGIFIWLFRFYTLDAFFSIFISIYMLISSVKLMKQTLRILLQFVPENLDLLKIIEELEKIEGIKNVHHVHLWQINENQLMFEAHVDLEKNFTIEEFEKIKYKCCKILSNFNINHVTLQPEFSTDDDKSKIPKHSSNYL